MESKQLKALNKVYLEAVYGQSAGQELAKREKDDNAAGAPRDRRHVVTNADKKGNTPAYQRYKAGDKNYKAADHMKEDIVDEGALVKAAGAVEKVGGAVKKGVKAFNKADEKVTKAAVKVGGKVARAAGRAVVGGVKGAVKGALNKEEINAVMGVIAEKQKDTPDQVKAVIAFDKARKGTDDATYDSEHGDKKQAKKERDYAKWQRDKGAEDAQKSGHPWEHAKGSTREKEGKKSVKHAHIKDSYDNQIHSTAIAGYANAYQAVYENWSGNEQNELATKEVKALQKAAKTGKGKYVAKADKIADEFDLQALVDSGKFSEEELNLLVWNEFEESREYSHNPEKYHDSEGHDKKLEKDKPYHKRSKSARMRDPERGINSPAFKKFMADRGM